MMTNNLDQRLAWINSFAKVNKVDFQPVDQFKVLSFFKALEFYFKFCQG